MAEWTGKCGVEIWAWCLMPNHVHLIAVPAAYDSLARAIGEAHRRYTRRINFREKWRGHLCQKRFASFPLDENYLPATARYIDMNPVAAGFVAHPEDYLWSSARAHLTGTDDPLVQHDTSPRPAMVSNWREFLSLSHEDELKVLKRHERTGRPLGSDPFVHQLEGELSRPLRPRKPGPKPVQGRDSYIYCPRNYGTTGLPYRRIEVQNSSAPVYLLLRTKNS